MFALFFIAISQGRTAREQRGCQQAGGFGVVEDDARE